MKNKKAEQKKRRDELKAQRRATKSLERNIPSIVEKPTIGDF